VTRPRLFHPVREPPAGAMTRHDLQVALVHLDLSARNTARLLGVHERAVRHWLADSRPIPDIVRRLLLLCLQCPGAFQTLQQLGPGLNPEPSHFADKSHQSPRQFALTPTNWG
jgi:hypothetical protein